jgi:ATP adenylyltransferase
MIFDSFVFPFNKESYIKGKKPDVDCILCSIVRDEKKVVSLKVAESETCFVSVNLYPYNSGHLILFPKRHILDLRDMDEKEEKELSLFTRVFVTILEETYHPSGFNIGYNMGSWSGASIGHLHQHIIPRFSNELGIVDLIGNSRVMIEHPEKTRKKLKSQFKKYVQKNKILGIKID